MTKTKEELMKLKEEYESLKTQLKQLSEDELEEVTGGTNQIWIFEKSFDDYQFASRQDVIGGWSLKEHEK